MFTIMSNDKMSPVDMPLTGGFRSQQDAENHLKEYGWTPVPDFQHRANMEALVWTKGETHRLAFIRYGTFPGAPDDFITKE